MRPIRHCGNYEDIHLKTMANLMWQSRINRHKINIDLLSAYRNACACNIVCNKAKGNADICNSGKPRSLMANLLRKIFRNNCCWIWVNLRFCSVRIRYTNSPICHSSSQVSLITSNALELYSNIYLLLNKLFYFLFHVIR